MPGQGPLHPLQSISLREAGIPSTSVTNELAQAINSQGRVPTTGPVDAPLARQSSLIPVSLTADGGSGTAPADFTYTGYNTIRDPAHPDGPGIPGTLQYFTAKSPTGRRPNVTLLAATVGFYNPNTGDLFVHDEVPDYDTCE